mmetsp:Transcript_32383/g.75192  ORF Transcript_32383/g.75192 Transcript_32383/m.75192 type:complete len:215 (-) Transcript_32383:263-907(-)
MLHGSFAHDDARDPSAIERAIHDLDLRTLTVGIGLGRFLKLCSLENLLVQTCAGHIMRHRLDHLRESLEGILHLPEVLLHLLVLLGFEAAQVGTRNTADVAVCERCGHTDAVHVLCGSPGGDRARNPHRCCTRYVLSHDLQELPDLIGKGWKPPQVMSWDVAEVLEGFRGGCDEDIVGVREAPFADDAGVDPLARTTGGVPKLDILASLVNDRR